MNSIPSTGITASHLLGNSSSSMNQPESLQLPHRRLPLQSSSGIPKAKIFDGFTSELSLPLSRRIIFPALYRSRSTPTEPTKHEETKQKNSGGDDLFQRRHSFITESTKPSKAPERNGQLDSLLALSPLSSRQNTVSVADANIQMKGGKPHITRVRPRPYPIRPLPRPPLSSLLLPEVDEHDDGEDDDESDFQPSCSSSSSLSSLFSSPSRVKLQSASAASPRRTILMRKQPIMLTPTPTAEETFKKPLRTPLTSILRSATTKTESVKVTFSTHDGGGGVPALVALKDDDELSSQSSSDMTSSVTPGDSPSKPPTLNRVCSSSSTTDNKGGNPGVKFDPRIWVREFQRGDEESEIWWTADDLERFKRHAVALIMARSNMESALIPTGTGRMVQKAPSQACKAFFTHAALRLDSADDDGQAEEELLKKEESRRDAIKTELTNVLIVDPHDICLTLFSKALKTLLPHIEVSTARTSEEAIRNISSCGGKRFDLILVEERLQLFHRQNRSTGNDDKSGPSSGAKLNNFHTGSALIQALKQLDVTRDSLFIGVSAHMDKDKGSLQKSGVNFCWAKPPPRLNQELLNQLLKCALEKRHKTELAKELFGSSSS